MDLWVAAFLFKAWNRNTPVGEFSSSQQNSPAFYWAVFVDLHQALMEIPCTADTLRPLFTYENGATYHGSWWETSFFNICHFFFFKFFPQQSTRKQTRRLGNNASLRQDGGVATWSRRTGPELRTQWSGPCLGVLPVFSLNVVWSFLTYFNEKHGELMKNMENSWKTWRTHEKHGELMKNMENSWIISVLNNYLRICIDGTTFGTSNYSKEIPMTYPWYPHCIPIIFHSVSRLFRYHGHIPQHRISSDISYYVCIYVRIHAYIHTYILHTYISQYTNM